MGNEKPVSMKTKEYRKVVKPLLERRRRARINGCLNELRNFILEATKQDSVQASKLEKADILEMTVHYLRLLIRQQCTAGSQTNATDLGRFRAGFSECANEVSMFVTNTSTVNPQIRARLLTHLSKCISQMNCVNVSSSSPVSRASPHPAGGLSNTCPPPPTYGQQQHPDDPMSPPLPPCNPHFEPFPREQRPYVAETERVELVGECPRTAWLLPTPKQSRVERLQSSSTTLNSMATTSRGLCSKPLTRHPSKPVAHHAVTNVSSVANSAVVMTMTEGNHELDVWRPW